MAGNTLLSLRLLFLLANSRWEQNDIIKLFTALVKRFDGRKEDFNTWMMKILYEVEIHRIRASDLKDHQSKEHFVDQVDIKINDIIKDNAEKTLEKIVHEICEETNVDKKVMAEVEDIVSSVSERLAKISAKHLQDENLSIALKKHLQDKKETLFTLCKAVKKTMEYKPRLTQMVSWCLLVLSKSSQLVQVGTGEGKSCIVAMFAAYQALMGKTPDIISSSSVLAERDTAEWSKFYNELKITVGVNTNKSEERALKKCYECQVVYGTAESFAADYLRQRFHRQDVRPKREFKCVIVDEVDSLMLDKGLEMVYLSTEMPLMESLNGILAEIWYLVSQLKHLDTGEILGPILHFSQILSETVFENDKIDEVKIVQNKENKNILKQLDNLSVTQMEGFLTMLVKSFPEYEYVFKLYLQRPDGTLQKLNEISSLGSSTRQEASVVLSECGQCRFMHSEENSVVTSLVKMYKKVLSASIKKQSDSCIPGLRDLIDGKLQIWIENALKATKMTLGHEYIFHGDGVVPVDYSCTGVVQNNMKWGDGLQQFIEMKHQTKLSNMNLITNFMSNVCLFRKYNNQIYGVTGTLGDETELNMLKKLYNGITTCTIPSFRPRKLYELEGLVLAEEEEWIRNICDVVKEQVSSTVYRGPRAALVICETINRANILYKALATSNLPCNLKLYTNNNMDNSTIINKEVREGEVIIATNLAGRGTDLKICENVNKAGGLFVIQTFLPLNVRVEQQAFGRTARQGSPGSAQLIMCCSHFSNSVKLIMALNASPNSLLSLLASLQNNLLDFRFETVVNCYLENPSSQNHKAMVSALTALLGRKQFTLMKEIVDVAKDARNMVVKNSFSGFLDKDIPEITKKEQLFSVYLDILDKIYEGQFDKHLCEESVSSLHECWGLWLLMYSSEEMSIDTLKQKLEKDISSAINKLLNKQTPSSMVFYYIRTGNKLRQNGNLTESIEMYNKAVEDGDYGEMIPQYNRALTAIMKKDAGYIAQALTDLEKADKAIDSYKLHMAQILTCVKSSSQQSQAEGSLLIKQFNMKELVLNLLKINIHDAVMKLRSANSTGRQVRLTEKHPLFLVEHIFVCPGLILLTDPLQLIKELLHVKSSGLDTIFSLETQFSLSGFLSRIFS